MTESSIETGGTRARGESRSHLWWIAAALVAGFFVLPRVFKVPESPLVGKEGTSFSLEQVANAYAADGKPTDAPLKAEDLKGKVVLLDFWATWCPPCKAETPILDGLYSRYKDRGLVVVGIDTSDATGSAGPWARSHGLHYPIVYDEGDVTAGAYGVNNLPTLILLSRDGKVVAARTGLTGNGELEKLIESTL